MPGALDASAAAVQDVGVDHGGADVVVAQELLDGADVVARLEQVGGERVAKGVARDVLGQSGVHGGAVDCALKHGLVGVVPSTLVWSLALFHRPAVTLCRDAPEEFSRTA